MAAWVDGYRERRGTAPLRSQVKRMASSAKRLAADPTASPTPRVGRRTPPARRAGADAHLDLVTAIGRYANAPGRPRGGSPSAQDGARAVNIDAVMSVLAEVRNLDRIGIRDRPRRRRRRRRGTRTSSHIEYEDALHAVRKLH